MKTKLFLAALATTVTLGVLTPTSASAHDSHGSGYYTTRVVGYDHCGRPIYRQVWVPTGHSHGHGGHDHGHGGHSGSHGGSHGGHSHGGGSSHGGGYIHAPGIDIHFGSSRSGHRHGR